MKISVQEAEQQVIDTLDEVTDPDSLSREDYKEVLSILIGDLQVRLEAAKEEDGET